MLNETFKTLYFDAGADGKVPVHSFLRYFSEAAAQDADNLNFGFKNLKKDNIVWVLAKIQLEQLATVPQNTSITLKTWHSFCDKLLSRREFIFSDQNGNPVIKGTSWWLLMNYSTRRIVRPTDELKALNPKNPDFVLEEWPLPNPKLEELKPIFTNDIIVRWSDMDINCHVNNTYYAAWATESVPEEIRSSKTIKKFMISFKNESKAGDKVTSKTYADKEYSGQGTALWHSLIRESDGKELVRVYTVWD